MKKGFTLIEMLVVLAITSLMLRQVAVYASDFTVRNQITSMVKDIRKYLLQSRNYAVSSQLPSGAPGNLLYNRFSPNFSGLGSTGLILSYIEDTGTTYPPKTIDMTGFVITQSQPLYFEVFTGKSVVGAGTTTIPRINDVRFTIDYTSPITGVGATKNIYVRPSGLIEVL